MDRLKELQEALGRAGNDEDRSKLQQQIDRVRAEAEKPLALVGDERKKQVEQEISPADRLVERNLTQPPAMPQPVQEPEQEPEHSREEEATRRELTRNLQRGPSQPGQNITFVNPRAVRIPPQPERGETRQAEQHGQAQAETPTQRILREREEREAVVAKAQPLSRQEVEAKVQRGVLQKDREARERQEAEAALKALEQGRVGKIEREFERGGRRM